MKISDRFADYGLIGGLFWILQLALWLAGKGHWTIVNQKLTIELGAVPPASFPLLVTIVGAFGLTTFFTTGLILDLLGSFYFQLWETFAFTRQVRQHLRWFRRVAELHGIYIQNDLSLLVSSPPFREQFKDYCSAFLFWDSRSRKAFIKLLVETWSRRSAYTRITSLMLANVVLASGADKLELLNDQMALWSSGRAVATALIMLYFESPHFETTAAMGKRLAAIQISSFAAMICGVLIALGFFERFCGTLFALCFVVNQKQIADLQLPLIDADNLETS